MQKADSNGMLTSLDVDVVLEQLTNKGLLLFCNAARHQRWRCSAVVQLPMRVERFAQSVLEHICVEEAETRMRA